MKHNCTLKSLQASGTTKLDGLVYCANTEPKYVYWRTKCAVALVCRELKGQMIQGKPDRLR